MKRREFIKILPAAAMLPAVVTTTAKGAEAAGEQPSSGSPGGSGSSEQSQGFGVSNPNLDDPGVHDFVHCDQFGIDSEGNPIADHLTGTGSDAGLKEHDLDNPHKMSLTQEEQDILNGSQGETMAKVLKTIVLHGELFGA